VDFWTEMTVSDPVIVSVLDQVLKEAAGRQVAAFEKRCKVTPIAEEDLGNGRQWQAACKAAELPRHGQKRLFLSHMCLI
jgi:hypothetical protein